MTIAIGQFTITDFSDINISSTEPVSPVLDMLWLDTSATPYTLKSWNGAAWVASRALSLAELDAIQDAKLNTRITTFYQPTVPTSTAVGDFWVDTSNNNHLYRAECIGADEIADGEWVSVRDTSATEALDDFVDAVFTPGVSNLQDQIDGKIETWFQEDDPNTWLEEERSAHNNDRWFKPSTQALKKYIASTNTWETIDDALAISAYTAASQAQDTADGKRRVFTTQPDPPYDVGDLWTEGSEGDLKRCKTAKTGDSSYYYEEGTENIVFDIGYSDGNGSQSKEEDYLSIISQDEGSVRTYVTTSAIDLTHINTLKIDWEGIQLTGSAGFAIVVISDNKTNNYDTFDARKIINFGFARTVTEVDVSSLEGSYYVRVHNIAGFPGDSYQVKVYNIEEVSEYNTNDWEPASNIKNRSFSTCPTNGKYKKDDLLIPSEGFTSGGKTFVAGEIYRALVDGDGVTFNAAHWVEASLISAWKKTGTVLIDGGQLAADSVEAASIKADTALVNFLNALNITAKYISATGITAGTLTLTADLNIESSDGNLEINGTQLKYTHADGTESRLGASGLRLYENGLLLPYISTVDAGMIDKFNETEGYWNYIVGNGYKKYFYLKRRGIRWLNQADNVKMLVTQGEELEWYDPSQYRHTGIKGMKYAVGDITNIAADVTVRSNTVSSGSTASMILLDLNANNSDGYYAQEYITINGETRKIVQYDGGNQRAYVDNSFSSAPESGDAYLIHTGPGGVNIEVESWYLAPWYSGSSGGEYYYALTFGYMLILNN